MEAIIQWALDHLNYWTITLLMAIESSFIPFPSEVVVPPAAFKAAGGGDLNVYLVVLFATLGADIGAVINYYLARYLGRPVVYAFARSKLGKALMLSSEKVHNAEVYFDKNGAISTLIGRLIPAVRQLISIPAGLAKMKLLPFLLYTTIGASLWNSILAALGYGLAQVPGIETERQLIDKVSVYSHEIGFGILGIVLVVGLIYWIRRYRKHSKKAQPRAGNTVTED
ncbi:membrane protein [Porphyromonas crevioricanis]|uniref:DedA family protein n=1 Tax=Porphyromonas crevioricanis TaxID=393921 RepID=UPI00052CE03E|nr:DedA family protein [Porphyromonas crevioricanis]KGN90782.1 membrane protein [Porphyromonas crevioricanis]